MHSPQVLIKELTAQDTPALEKHFLALDKNDRRLRFGSPLNDHAVRHYVRHIDFGRDAVFGVADEKLRLVAAGHLARSVEAAEFGVSVLAEHRGRGLGGAMLRRAHMHARNWGAPRLFMHCLSENDALMRLARKQGMDIVAESGEAEAWLKLPPADTASYMNEVFEQRVALFDYALKAQLEGARRAVGALQSGGRPPPKKT